MGLIIISKIIGFEKMIVRKVKTEKNMLEFKKTYKKNLYFFFVLLIVNIVTLIINLIEDDRFIIGIALITALILFTILLAGFLSYKDFESLYIEIDAGFDYNSDAQEQAYNESKKKWNLAFTI